MARELVYVTDGVWVATSRNYATTSTIVARGGNALLIDPAWEPDELTGLAEALADLELSVTTGFHTHAHHDHLLWCAALGDAPRWATATAVDMVGRFAVELREQLGEELAAFVGEHFARVEPLTGSSIPAPFGEGSPVGQVEEVEVIEHHGHAYGHGALWFPERGLLVAGDMLSDIELPLPFTPHGLGTYLPGLYVLEPYVAKARFLIPGHGTPTDRPLARLDADRRVLDALLRGEDVDDPRRSLPGGEKTYGKLKEVVAGHLAG